MPCRAPAIKRGEGNAPPFSQAARLLGGRPRSYNAGRASDSGGAPMAEKILVKPRTRAKPKTQRPPLYKVILLNDDFTPREFVVQVLKAVFRMNADQAYRVMLTAHKRGACVIAVYTRDVAETKAKEATELARSKGYPLFFATEKEG
jgi:ATP-dependent Clp protease adaptor protein ClpS